MSEGDEITFRPVPGGEKRKGTVRGILHRKLEIASSQAAELKLDVAIELESEGAIYLGVVEQVSDGAFWVSVEHYLDRQKLAKLQSVWGDPERYR